MDVALFIIISSAVQPSNALSSALVQLGRCIVLKYVPANPLSATQSTDKKSGCFGYDLHPKRASLPISFTFDKSISESRLQL